jgi:dephospho-CoA kinase
VTTIPRKPILGLVGAIGAGKSTAAAILARHGGAVIDADKLGHDVLESLAVKPQVLARWPQVRKSDGTVDRRAVASIVFANPNERHVLESWVFPEIRRRCEAAMADAEANPRISLIVLDAAVMLEAGWHDACDRLIYIDAPREQRMHRLAVRSGWSDADLDAREAAQLPAAEKKNRAAIVFLNDGTPQQLEDRMVSWLNANDITS